MVRVTAGVEAHTHEYIATAHEDQKFGFSINSGDAFEATEQIRAYPGLELLGLHSHIGSQIFDSSGFEVAARRVMALHAQISEEIGIVLPELDLGGGFGIAYTTQDDPSDPAQLAIELTKIVTEECKARDLAVPRLSIEPGRAIVGPAVCTVYEVGTVKAVELDGGAVRTYVSVDGGHERQHPHGAVRRRLRLHPGQPHAPSAPVLLTRVVGKHCEAGDIVVKDEFLPGDLAPGDLVAVPGTGAYCRSMASNYNHALRPPVIAVNDGVATVLVRRETEDDLLRLDARSGRPDGSTESDEPRSVPIRVALLGCGVVGSQVARLLHEQADDLAARVGAPVELVGVAVRRLGLARDADLPAELFTTDAEGLVARADVDVVVEVIGGIEPARTLILSALAHGASVVTANKALLAEDGATPVRRRRGCRPRPLLRGRRGRSDPDPATAARVPRR